MKKFFDNIGSVTKWIFIVSIAIWLFSWLTHFLVQTFGTPDLKMKLNDMFGMPMYKMNQNGNGNSDETTVGS